MDTQTGSSSRDADSVIDRRRLLQGAVAAGVGVVAWSSPTVTAIAQTPGYAAVCTGGISSFVIDYRNTACNCGTPPDSKFVSYKDPYNENSCSVQAAPREVTFRQGPGATDPLLTNSGTCPPTTPGGAGAYARIVSTGTNPDDFNFCRLKVESVQGNCSTGDLVVEAFAYSDIVPLGESKSVAMPNVSCKADGNIFLRISLECADDDACLVLSTTTTTTTTTKPPKN